MKLDTNKTTARFKILFIRSCYSICDISISILQDINLPAKVCRKMCDNIQYSLYSTNIHLEFLSVSISFQYISY